MEDPPPQLLTVQVGTTDLASYLTKLSQQVNRHGRMLGNLTEEIRQCRTSIDQVKLNMNESIARVQKSVSQHDTQLRIVLQQADASVSSSQFAQATLQLKEKIRALEAHVETGVAQENLKEVMQESVREWQAKEGDASLHATVDKAVNSVKETLEKRVSELTAQLAQEAAAKHRDVSTIIDSIRDETVRNKRAAVDDVQSLKEMVNGNERRFDDHIDKVKGSVHEAMAECSHRITNFYNVMSIPEDTVNEVEGAMSRGESPRANAGGERPPMAQSPAQAVSMDGHDGHSNTAVLQTPLFVNLRHQILNDIAERVGTSSSQQSQDFDSEMTGVRKEMKQHATAHRVVELINQYADTETPLKVQGLVKRMDELDDEKIATSTFIDALRGKSDVVVVDTKADRAQVTEFVDSFKMQMIDVQVNLKELNAERQEFREILRDVLYMHKRANVQQSAMATQLGIDTTQQQSPLQSSKPRGADSATYLPLLQSAQDDRNPVTSGDAADEAQAPYLPSSQGIDPRPPPPPDASPRPMLRDTPPSRQGVRTPVNRRSVKPLTDHRATHTPTSVPSSTTPNGTRNPRWTPRSSMGPATDVSGGDAGAVIPLTQSQKAYAKTVGAQSITPTGPPEELRTVKPTQVDKVHSPADTSLPHVV